jgi:flap endonuclease-1
MMECMMFAEPSVLKGEDLPALKWSAANEEGLVSFLVGEKSFNEDRVRKAVQRVNAAKSKSMQGTTRKLPVSIFLSKSSCHGKSNISDLQVAWRHFLGL